LSDDFHENGRIHRIFMIFAAGIFYWDPMVRKAGIALLFFLLLSVFSCHNNEGKKQIVQSADTLNMSPSEKTSLDSLLHILAIFKNDPCFAGASVGYIIMDNTSGMPRMIAEQNSSSQLIPASIQKLLTTSAALEIYGENVYREVTMTNLMSINWRANRLMQKIGQTKYGKYDFEHGSKAVKEFWKDKGLDTTGIYLLDGSGRSRDNKLSPKQIADVLYKMTLSHIFPVFYNSLPLAGLTGTMHKWLIGTVGQGRVRAKTGSLAGVRSYAGYVNTIHNKRLIFVFIVNDFSCSVNKFKKKMERVMVRMTEI
jgi:D-alanyl-D-alanine carboxypeptidase